MITLDATYLQSPLAVATQWTLRLTGRDDGQGPRGHARLNPAGASHSYGAAAPRLNPNGRA